jgi:hypothetical protein
MSINAEIIRLNFWKIVVPAQPSPALSINGRRVCWRVNFPFVASFPCVLAAALLIIFQ